MAMDRATLEGYLREAFPDAVITLTDLAGDNDHWSADIVSELFRGKSRVAQHQLVYAALKGRMGGALHALALTTRPPG
jgi:stress-induced morphogen